MGLFKDVSKIGILISFMSAVIYEFTGANFLRAISLISGMLSLTILASYLTNLKHISKTEDSLHYLKLLK